MAKNTRRGKRATYHYLSRSKQRQISKLAKYVPALEKYKGKERITTAQYAAVQRASKSLAHTQNLRPVTKKQAAALKKQGLLAEVTYRNPKTGKETTRTVNAVRLGNTSPNAKIRVRKDGVLVSSNGRNWEYHSASPEPDALADMGVELLARPTTIQIALWTVKGRANETFRTERSWLAWLQREFERYSDVDYWINGIAAEVGKEAVRKYESSEQHATETRKRAGKGGNPTNRKAKRKGGK